MFHSDDQRSLEFVTCKVTSAFVCGCVVSREPRPSPHHIESLWSSLTDDLLLLFGSEGDQQECLSRMIAIPAASDMSFDGYLFYMLCFLTGILRTVVATVESRCHCFV